MNIQKFKRSLYYLLFIVTLTGIFVAAASYRHAKQSWSVRYYSQLPKLSWTERAALHNEVANKLNAGVTSAYAITELRYKLELLEQAERRNYDYDSEAPPPEVAKEYQHLPPLGMLRFQHSAAEHEIVMAQGAAALLDADRVYAVDLSRVAIENFAAEQNAGDFNWKWIAFSIAGMLLLFSAICAVVYICRGREGKRKFPIFLMPFDPKFWSSVILAPKGLVNYLNGEDIDQRIRIALQYAGLAISSVLSLTGAGAVSKAFGQQKKDDVPDKPAVSIVVQQPDRWTFTFETGVASIYHGHFVGANFHNGIVVTTSLTATHNPSGFWASIWTSKAATNRFKGNAGDEIDLSAGINKKVHGFNVGVGINYVNAKPLTSLTRGDVVIFDARLGRTIRGGHDGFSLEPFTHVRYATPLRHKGPEHGWVAEFGAKYHIPIAKPLFVSARTSVIGDTGPFGFNPGWHANLDAALNVRLSNHLTLVAPSGKYTAPLTRSGDGRHPLASVSSGIRYEW